MAEHLDKQLSSRWHSNTRGPDGADRDRWRLKLWHQQFEATGVEVVPDLPKRCQTNPSAVQHRCIGSCGIIASQRTLNGNASGLFAKSQRPSVPFGTKGPDDAEMHGKI